MPHDQSSYILLGIRTDGSIPAVDVIVDDGPHDALTRAERFLAEHTTCDQVEVWRGGVVVATLTRPQQVAQTKPGLSLVRRQGDRPTSGM